MTPSSRISACLLLSLTHLAPGLEPWEKIFKPQKGWETSTVADAKEKSILTQSSGKPFFFTNASNPKKAGYLQTIEQYGDCTVETEFMIPKGSNSGIYLMGRYEIQILDSHGKKEVGYGDMGGIYRRWDNNRDPKGFDGVAPSENAAKPAGEWQKLVIRFRAPRLDSEGKLVEKPIFLSVVLNGKTVHENVTVNGPTRAAQRSGWASKDHVFIQGDHGPIAFRAFKMTPENFEKQK